MSEECRNMGYILMSQAQSDFGYRHIDFDQHAHNLIGAHVSNFAAYPSFRVNGYA
jgi:hypothetical protein